MSGSRSSSRGRRVARDVPWPSGDPVADLAGAALVGGGSWFLGRLRDRLLRRQPPQDPLQLPLAEGEAPSSGNVRVTQVTEEEQLPKPGPFR